MENPETLEFYIQSGKRVSAKVKVSDDFYGNWHHIAGIYDGLKLDLYIDNKRVAETRFNGQISNTPFPLCIGRDADTQDQGEFSGRLSKMVIDDVKIFDHAVSLNELQNNIKDAVLSLDFESDTIDGSFFAVGLGGRTYGIIWPNREVQPEINQIKKSGQPIKIEAIDIENGVIKITNHHQFKNLNDFTGVWEMSVNGDTIQHGFFGSELAPGVSVLDTITFRMPQIEEGSECILTVSFVLKNKTNWAEEGYEVAWEQFIVPTPQIPKELSETKTRLSVIENKNEISISGGDFNYVFDRQTGALKSIQKNETEYLSGEPEFKVWRSPLANDTDPWGSQQFTDRNFTLGFGRSIDNQLRTLGLKDLVTQLEEIEVRQLNSKVVVLTKVFSNSSLPVNRRMNSWEVASAFEQNNVWTILPDGTIQLEQEIIPHGTMPDMLQKVGLQFQLEKAFSNIEWYGRGPFENYPDRKTGAKVGLYFSNADEMYVPYITPQEYGNRSDVRWLKVLNNNGRGLFISGEDLFNFSLHKYSDENLERAVYSYQLKESPKTILNMDYEVTGVGGTANRQLQKYRVLSDIKKYKLTLKPF